MCTVEEMISCQLCFYPLAKQSYDDDIKKVLEIIRDSGLKHQTGIMSTVIQGDQKRIFALLQKIFSTMAPICGFVMDVKISNVCG